MRRSLRRSRIAIQYDQVAGKDSAFARPKLGAACRGGADRHRAGAAVERDGATLDRGEVDGGRGQGRLAGGPPIPTLGAHCQITGKRLGET